MTRRLVLTAVLFLVPATVVRAELPVSFGGSDASSGQPVRFVSALSLGGHAGAFSSGQAVGLVGTDLRLLEFRRVSASRFVFCFHALELGLAAQGVSFGIAMLSVGYAFRDDPGSVGYAVLTAGLYGVFAECVYVPRAPWPFELSARVGGAIGPDPMEFPDPALHARASVGVRAGVGRWRMR